jgi:hypothetical protein
VSITFIACVERGELEAKTLLLCRSIRRYGGRFANAPIFTFQPRRGTAVSPATRRALASLGVTHVTERLNSAFPDYAIGNKVFAAARGEELAATDVVAFLDSDTIITSEPNEMDLPDGIDAAARPVDYWRHGEEPLDDPDHPHWRTHHRRVASTGPGDPMDDYWRRMYALCGVRGDPWVETVGDRKKIRAYFNSGLAVARRSAGIFAAWKRDFLRLIDANHIPPNGDWHYLDQLSLAVALARVWDRVKILDGRYNYPLIGRPLLAQPLRGAQLEELVHVHYNRYFNVPGFLSSVRPVLRRESEVVRWLGQYLPLQPTLQG